MTHSSLHPEDYFIKTKSALYHLFESISEYRKILYSSRIKPFIGSYKYEENINLFEKIEKELDYKVNDYDLQYKTQNKFFAESFALACLCGSVLQIATKAIELFPTKKIDIAQEWESSNKKPNTIIRRFITGRLIRGVPLGLIIYAGRNQHTHFEPLLSNYKSNKFNWLQAQASGIVRAEFVTNCKISTCSNTLTLKICRKV